jgi:hypothetical protein
MTKAAKEAALQKLVADGWLKHGRGSGQYCLGVSRHGRRLRRPHGGGLRVRSGRRALLHSLPSMQFNGGCSPGLAQGAAGPFPQRCRHRPLSGPLFAPNGPFRIPSPGAHVPGAGRAAAGHAGPARRHASGVAGPNVVTRPPAMARPRVMAEPLTCIGGASCIAGLMRRAGPLQGGAASAEAAPLLGWSEQAACSLPLGGSGWRRPRGRQPLGPADAWGACRGAYACTRLVWARLTLHAPGPLPAAGLPPSGVRFTAAGAARPPRRLAPRSGDGLGAAAPARPRALS